MYEQCAVLQITKASRTLIHNNTHAHKKSTKDRIVFIGYFVLNTVIIIIIIIIIQ
jgi:hypothetical protein